MKTGVKIALGLTGIGVIATTAYLIYSQQSGNAKAIINQTVTDASVAVSNAANNPTSAYEGKFLNVKGSNQYWFVKDGMKHLLPSHDANVYVNAGLISAQTGPWVSQALVDSLPAGVPWSTIPTKADLRGLGEINSRFLN